MAEEVATALGWVTPILGVLSLIAIAAGWGKWIERFNGLGKRVTDLGKEVGDRVAESEGIHATMEAAGRANGESIRILLAQHTDLIQKLGEQKRSTEACHDDTTNLGIDLGAKITELIRSIATLDKSVAVRLTAIETTLKIQPPKEGERQ